MYRWVEHTGEVELEIEAPAEEAVFTEAVRAMAELLGDEDDRPPAGAGGAVREVEVRAPDRARLLADFLGELAFLAETGDFVPGGVDALATGEGRLRATVRGRLGSPPHLVKAVTLHRLAFDAVDGGWRARVVMDV